LKNSEVIIETYNELDGNWLVPGEEGVLMLFIQRERLDC